MSDLTFPLIGLTTLLGYYFSQNDKNVRIKENVRNKVEGFDKPIGDNIYSSNEVEKVNSEILKRSLENYKLAEEPSKTGMLPPLFNTYSIVGNDSSTLNDDTKGLSSIELSKVNDINRISNVFEKDKIKVQGIDKMPMFNSNVGQDLLQYDAKINFSDVTKDNSNVNILTGLPFEDAHNNMVPFFGGNMKQNIETFSNQSLLDNRSGNTSTFKHKTEISSLYDKSADNIYGAPVFTTQINTDRYIPSLYRQNEKPLQPERISAPISGSINNPLTPVLGAKTVNELRPGNKPKETYEGRIISGQRGEVRGIQGKVEKQRPDTYYEQTSDQLFKGPGAYVAPKIMEDYSTNLKQSSRQSYNMEYYGVVNNSNLSKTVQRINTNIDNSNELAASLFQTPKRQNFENDYARNVSGNIIEKYTNDYGKSSMVQYESQRSTTGDKEQLLNANKYSAGLAIRPQDDMKNTLKQTTLDGNNLGNIKTIFDKNSTNTYHTGISDVTAKQTHKQTFVDNKYMGQAQKEAGMGYLVNKYDAKTTGKEIITNNSDFIPNPNMNSEASSRFKYSNLEIKEDKQKLLTGQRPSGPQQFQIPSGKASYADIKTTFNMKLKENEDDRDKMNVYTTQVIPDKNLIGMISKPRFDNSPEDTIDRLDPSVVSVQLKSNPYVIDSTKR
jgi:hypothetical protein